MLPEWCVEFLHEVDTAIKPVYRFCWFKSISKTSKIEDNRRIRESARRGSEVHISEWELMHLNEEEGGLDNWNDYDLGAKVGHSRRKYSMSTYSLPTVEVLLCFR